MESKTKKLIHTVGALADLGQEIAKTTEFNEMVRTSLHLLLGTLAIRRGAVVECLPGEECTECLAVWGLGDDYQARLTLSLSERAAILNAGVCTIGTTGGNPAWTAFLLRHQAELQNQGIDLVVPMVVRGVITGLVLLGGKASGQAFQPDDMEVICAMVRHVGVGIHTHRLLE
ncbi:MAG: GAF domain-containing protein, partial [Pyrinomonadaceae bacterium]